MSDNSMEQILQGDPAPKASGHGEYAVALTLLATMLLLYVAYVFRYRIGSDETQHLHVVWGWANGLLQYRDVFDNHMPLFQMLMAPLLRLAGERPETLLLARIAMLPLFVAMGVLTYKIASSCYPPRAALWATIIGSLAPDFFLCSMEFRTDV